MMNPSRRLIIDQETGRLLEIRTVCNHRGPYPSTVHLPDGRDVVGVVGCERDLGHAGNHYAWRYTNEPEREWDPSGEPIEPPNPRNEETDRA